MAIPFPPEEIERRRQAVARTLVERGLDGLLCLRQASRYWLGGDDSGDCFECLLLDAAGDTALLTREPGPAEIAPSPQVGEMRYWSERPGNDALAELRTLLKARGMSGGRFGIEYAGLSGDNVRRLDAGLAGISRLEDAADLVDGHRAIKSPGEMACVRRAAGLADEALDAALAVAGPGAWEGDILADMQGAVLRGGGDYPSRGFVVASGVDARTGRRHVARHDRVLLEWAGVYRRYHAAMARTMAIGEAHPRHRTLHALAVDAMAACLDACAPGATCGEVFDAQAQVIDAAGVEAQRGATCGHGVGAIFAPTGADWPPLRSGSEVEIVPAMALLLRVVLHDPAADRALVLGQTVEVSEAGSLPLHCHRLERLSA